MYLPNLKRILEEYQDSRHRKRKLNIVIPDKNELPSKAVGTVAYCMDVNLLAHQKYGVSRRIVDGIYLSDQSDDAKTDLTKSKLEEKVRTVRERFLSEDCEGLFPMVGYFRMDKRLGDLVLNDWSHLNELGLLCSQLKEKGMSGKGLNMYLSALLIDFLKGNKSSALLYLDSDYRNRSVNQVLALALPLSHMGYDSVTGSFRRYHKSNDGEMERGGRVNAATRAFFDMLTEASLMKEMGYPLCGDQGAGIDVINDLRWPLEFGVETAWRIQAHSWVNHFSRDRKPLLCDRKSLQVDIGGNDDVPIAEGKPVKEVFKGITRMSREVAEAALATIDSDFLKGRWRNHRDFMKEFKRLQDRSIRTWKDWSTEDYGKVLPICGGIDDKTLAESTRRVVGKVAKAVYDNQGAVERLRAQFLPSLSHLRHLLESKYKKLGRDIRTGLEYL